MAALSVLGAGVQGIAGFGAARSEEDMLRGEAAQARQNAAQAIKEARVQADAVSLQGQKVKGSQEAAFAASGLEGGSAMAVMAESKINAELDRLSVLFGGDVRARGFMSEAEAKMKAARDTRTAGIFGLLGSGFKMGSGLAKMGPNIDSNMPVRASRGPAGVGGGFGSASPGPNRMTMF